MGTLGALQNISGAVEGPSLTSLKTVFTWRTWLESQASRGRDAPRNYVHEARFVLWIVL
jgi:hypothetical protein